MDVDGSISSTSLKKIREEMSEIHSILVLFSTKHYFDVDKLSSHLVWFRQDEDMKAVIKFLQERCPTYLGKESDLLIAINGRSALRQHLAKIRSTTREIEKYMLKYRNSRCLSPVPPSLLICYHKGTHTSLDRLQILYDILTDQQLRIALRDAKNAHSPSHVPEPTGPVLASSSSFVDTVNDPPPTYNPQQYTIFRNPTKTKT
ncbi:hypothetical protein CPB97_011278 [Podila verticillata]|nr:hypothetical protein CPB97_011278 [Podila verticillata]